ncbi:hypothetical protein H1P_1890006 [Hyella patelloides LEGE 07179]|uniref:Uncharacterized protein n=1 Tax=Hyella patelloides LEGE 07179 TaxID=945734 RepID=A0A563VP55_9CYAN|nr:hypothetical protein [Hyella patelloides]VEP13191.1 hypothetical protein H1P_1890006 [Hyella patelloides LEGE 07179]
MKSEKNQQQTNWLAETEELNDVEASQVNGGYGFDAHIAQLVAQLEAQQEAQAEAQAEMTALNAAMTAANTKGMSPGQ